MEYTEKEIKNIKTLSFDKGWRYGVLFGSTLMLLAGLLISFL